MKKQIKSVLLLLGLILIHPQLAEASSEVVNQKSEVVEQTNIDKTNAELATLDDLMTKVDALILQNMILVDTYNNQVESYISLRNEYNSIKSENIETTIYDRKNYAEVKSLTTTIVSEFDNISEIPYLRQACRDYIVLNDSLNKDINSLTDTCHTMEERIIEAKEELARIEEEKKRESNRHAPTHNNHLTKSSGVYYGPSGKETYYNLNMSGIVSIMRSIGNNDEYWVREDGVKMLGDYIMVAANLSVHPRGSLVETSLGIGIVCDTGGFVHNGSGVSLDIATSW